MTSLHQKSFYPCPLLYSKSLHLVICLLNMDVEYNKGCKYSNNSTKFKCTSASDTFIAPRGTDLLVNDKMEGVRIIVISTACAFSIGHIARFLDYEQRVDTIKREMFSQKSVRRFVGDSSAFVMGAMFLASALNRGIHPPEILKNV